MYWLGIDVGTGGTRALLVDDRGKVTLEGRVKVWADRGLVTQAAWSAPGVKEVEDLLTVA